MGARLLFPAVAASCLVLAASPATAQRSRPIARAPAPTERPVTPYAGDCGPNPPPGYRYDLQGWRTGFNRDFYCYMLDEN